MQGLRSILLALVVASMTLTFSVASQDAAMVGGRNPHQHARRNTVRSIVLDHGKKLKAKRATQAQQEAAARSGAWMANYAKQNKAWQEAAMESLKEGKTPEDFDTWSKSHGGSTGSGSGSATASSSTSKQHAAASKSSSSGSEAVKATATSTTKENATTSKSDDDDDDDQCDDGCDDDDDDDDGDNSSSSTSQSQPSSTSSTKQHHHSSATSSSSSTKNTGSGSSSSTSSSQSATSTSSGSSGSGLLADIIDVVTGTVTYYNTGLGACGWTSSDSDYIVALPVGVWNELGGTVSNGNVVCGHKLKVSNGKTAIEVKIVDQCPSCEDTHLDLSPSAFKALGAESAGVLDVSWGWVGAKPSKN